VASAHPLASQAGLSMLQQGGNAIDAIVAIAATLNVVEPFMSGAAGVGYMVIRPAGESQPIVLDFIGHAPAGATPDRFQEEGSKDFGILSPLIPGSLAGWLTALEHFGSLDRATVFAPAIEFAEHGYPVTIKNHLFMSHSRERLRQWRHPVAPTCSLARRRSRGNCSSSRHWRRRSARLSRAVSTPSIADRSAPRSRVFRRPTADY
jgi:gamma-glutamyltranspeptidase